jgi:nitrous oxide reductase accessory protein NosL
MEVELTAQERIEHILKEAESFARFIAIEGKRQSRSQAAVYIAVAHLARLYSETDPELWADAQNAFYVKARVKEKSIEIMTQAAHESNSEQDEPETSPIIWAGV